MVWMVLAAISHGPYVAWWKVLPLVVVMLLWGRLVTWIDKDSPAVMLPRVPLNIANIVGGALGFLLFFVLPSYAAGLLALIVIVLAEGGVYLGMRNSKVGLGDLSGQFTEWMASWRGEKEVKVIQGEVQLISKGGNLMEAPASDDPVLPAYEATQTLLTDPLRRNAERID